MTALHGVAIGDLHLDALRNHFPADHLALQLGALTRSLQHAYNAGCTDAFLLGDLGQGVKNFTNKYTMSDEAKTGLLRTLHPWDGKIRIHAYDGNHDSSDYDSSTLDLFKEMTRLGMFKTITFYDKPTALTLEDQRISILPYPRQEPLTKKPALNFGHYEVSGTVTDSGMKSRIDEVFDFGKHHFVQGHLHTRQRVRNHYYPGTLYQMSFGEQPDKGFSEFWYEDGKFKARHIPTALPYKLINLRINTRADLKQIEQSPTTKYKLFLHESVVLRAEDAPRLANVVNQLPFSTEEEAVALETAELMLETQAVAFDTNEVLTEWLVSKGLTKSRIKQARALIERVSGKAVA